MRWSFLVSEDSNNIWWLGGRGIFYAGAYLSASKQAKKTDLAERESCCRLQRGFVVCDGLDPCHGIPGVSAAIKALSDPSSVLFLGLPGAL